MARLNPYAEELRAYLLHPIFCYFSDDLTTYSQEDQGSSCRGQEEAKCQEAQSRWREVARDLVRPLSLTMVLSCLHVTVITSIRSPYLRV